MVEVRSFSTGFETLTFWLKIALYPEPYRAWMDYPDEPEDAGWGMWCRQVGEGYYGDPGAPTTDPTFWNPLRLNAAEQGPFLTLTLERHVIPFLTAMLDRDRLLSAIKTGELTGLQAPFTVLADEGWTPDLLTELARMSRITSPEDDQADGVQRLGDSSATASRSGHPNKSTSSTTPSRWLVATYHRYASCWSKPSTLDKNTSGSGAAEISEA